MAISLDNSASAHNDAGGTNTLSFSITVAANASMLLVFVGATPGNAAGTCTANGTSMTSEIFEWVAGNMAMQIFALASPPTGSVTVAITLGANSVDSWQAWAVSLIGTATASFVDGTNGSSIAAAGSTSDSLTPTVSNDWLLDAFHCTSGTSGHSVTNGAGGQTAIGSVFQSGGTSGSGTSVSYLPNPPLSSTAMGWSLTGASTRLGHAMIGIKAGASGKLFIQTDLNGLGAGGPFFHNPIG